MVAISSTVGKRGEFERRLDEQRRHQDQHGEDDRDREREVEQERRQRQDQDDEDGQHADRERDVAALEHAPMSPRPGSLKPMLGWPRRPVRR